jgi:hypothetical protein
MFSVNCDSTQNLSMGLWGCFGNFSGQIYRQYKVQRIINIFVQKAAMEG